MAAPINPAGKTAQGNVRVVFVETLSDVNAPKLTEINAATSLDVSCVLYEGGWAPAQSANKVTAPRRLCSRKVFEKFGTTTESLGDLAYSIDPQAAAGSDGKKAYEKLTEGTTGYFVERLGKDAKSVDFATGDFVNVYPVTLGPQMIGGDTSDEAAEFQVSQSVAITGDVTRNVAVVAGP